MKRTLITFGGARYDAITAQVVRDAPKMGADEVKVYDDKWLLTTEFGQSPEFQWLLNHRGVGNEKGRRGFGWFSWKPYIIQHALSRVQDGDVVMYLDADTRPIADFSVLFEECARIGGHMAFMATAKAEPLCNRQWCKRDCFIAMGMDEPKYWHGPAAVCRFILFQKGAPGVKEFLAVWQMYCLDQRCQTFDPSIAEELPGPHGDGPEAGFREHRTEQAIYTNLCIHDERRLYREACEFGKDCPQDWGIYPQLFSQGGRLAANSLAGSRFRNIE